MKESECRGGLRPKQVFCRIPRAGAVAIGRIAAHRPVRTRLRETEHNRIATSCLPLNRSLSRQKVQPASPVAHVRTVSTPRWFGALSRLNSDSVGSARLTGSCWNTLSLELRFCLQTQSKLSCAIRLDAMHAKLSTTVFLDKSFRSSFSGAPNSRACAACTARILLPDGFLSRIRTRVALFEP